MVKDKVRQYKQEIDRYKTDPVKLLKYVTLKDKGIDPTIQNKENKMRGCAGSATYLTVEQDENMRLVVKVSSRSKVIGGWGQILVDIFTGATVAEVVSLEPAFYNMLLPIGKISMMRQNTIYAMISAVVEYCMEKKLK